MNWSLFVLPLLSAFMGWLANRTAVQMLFYPTTPKRIWGMTFQGIFPKRKQLLAEKLSSMVANGLINFQEIAQQLNDPQQLAAVRPYIEQNVDTFLHIKLQEKLPVLATFVGSGTLGKIKDGLMEEIDALLPEVIAQYADNLAAKINAEEIVRVKIEDFVAHKMEAFLLGTMRREFRQITLLGGAVGFLIGLLQVLLLLALK